MDIINRIWAFCDEASWVIPAHNFMNPVWGDSALLLPDTTEKVKLFMDIMGSDIGAMLAIAYYLFGQKFDEVTPSINRRLLQNLEHRMITPLLTNDDYPWTGQGR